MKKGTVAKKRFCAVVLFAMLLTDLFSGATMKESATVIVRYNGEETVYETYAKTAGDFTAIEEIAIKDNDKVSFDDDTEIIDGMLLEIDTAKYVTVYDNGESYGAITYAYVVEDVLVDFERPLDDADKVFPKRGTAVYDGMEITVSRAACVYFTNDGVSDSYYTYQRTVGSFLTEVGVSVDSQTIVSPSEDTLITSGMQITVTTVKPASASGSQISFDIDLSNARVITCEATAYTSSEDETWPYSSGITATGVPFQVGVVAVDPDVIPLKSKLYIETEDGSYVYGYCVADDTGGAIKGNKVDLAMNTKEECFDFGRRTVKVYILS
ncbi:MAG: ubiquitin-like domain-containing protein [Clostridia bacterium]|nr:ubiquitin-like domain-containing protein [Clostridia bacterium]